MIAIEYFFLCVALMGAGGYYISYRHGIEQYGEGMIDALTMHHAGSLTYEAVDNDDGTVELEIKIKRNE